MNTVLQRYGPAVQAEENVAVDRAALGRIVFQDAAERRWLEHLIHPIVRERFDQALSLHAKTPAVVLMIPLLFEAGLESLCSEIWLVDCDESQQLGRLIMRDGLSPEAAAHCRPMALEPETLLGGSRTAIEANLAPGAQAMGLLNATAPSG